MEDQIVELVKSVPVLVAVLSALGSASVLASIVVKATKSTVDDAKWAELRSHVIVGKLIGLIERFSLVKPKDE